MGWKVVTALRYSGKHPDSARRGRVFTSLSERTYATRAEAEGQARGSARMDKLIGRQGVLYSVREVRESNPSRRRGPPKGKVPPHLRRFLFKKGHR